MTTRIYRILVINPGSTSTKIGIFDNEDCLVKIVVRHTKEELSAYTCENGSVFPQKDLRRHLITNILEEKGISFKSIHAIVGRAGRLPPMSSGTYLANDDLILDVPDPLVHPALLGAVIAKEMGDEWGVPSYFVDPTVVDEISDIARVTGIPGINRGVIFHALNHKAVARRCASEIGKKYKDSNFVVAHLGGGISIGAHEKGIVVDVTNASNGEGPFSPERAGSVPAIPIIEMCFSGQYTQDEMISFFTKKGGLNAHMGNSDFRELESRYLDGEEKAKLLYESMAYKISKDIASMSAVLKGNVDRIIITGGLAYSNIFTDLIKERVWRIAEIVIYPGEDELLALAQGALRVLTGEESAITYTSKKNGENYE